MLKIGLGYDLHKLAPGRKLILGGVELPGKWGCVAHSDGDALIHAVIDSLLSPMNLGDIGSLFPDTDEQFRGISSMKLLEKTVGLVAGKLEIQNIDCVVILDQPKILLYLAEMKKNIAGVLGIPENRIGIKGKTSENTRLTSVECHAVVLMEIK